ncbi:hypothetical protein [Tumebacillus permanentifrigoris]|uniref:Uncharacterized protein n=1 Tax=Tumebacillus permanentifrigoris TaxID=378543 RepID=A0A316D2V8_9BACL|nr:hypothetical protein [Tumebacillus permanentifrigoris]PWK05157.1 hypothetical protein C7459_12633 [Tumebacillus permanentifrigoris]
MNDIVFWILYLLGGLSFLTSCVYSKKYLRNPSNVISAHTEISSMIMALGSGEVVWIAFWIMASNFAYTEYSLLAGILPLGIAAFSLIAFLYAYLKGRLAEKKKEQLQRDYVLPVVEHWINELPGDCKIEQLVYHVDRGRNGRITVGVSMCTDWQVDWHQQADRLKRGFEEPIIVEIRSQGKKVYPSPHNVNPRSWL